MGGLPGAVSRVMRVRPASDEYASAFQAYVGRVPDGDVMQQLRAQGERSRVLFAGIGESKGGFRYAPGKWTVKQVVNHVIDAERVFAYRALCIARNDLRPLPGFDENDYAGNAPASSLALRHLRNEFQAVRSATICLFRNLPEEAWLRRGRANQYEVTVRGLAFQIAGHERHHVKILRERYLV